MGIFSRILDKLRGQSSAPAAQDTGQLAGSPQQGQPATQPAASQAPLQNVDIEAVLSELAARKSGGGNYKQSIVDLLKLLDLDSSMNARKELAQELGVNAGAHGSAEQNIALHKAVIKKLEENGGKVPESMKN